MMGRGMRGEARQGKGQQRTETMRWQPRGGKWWRRERNGKKGATVRVLILTLTRTSARVPLLRLACVGTKAPLGCLALGMVS